MTGGADRRVRRADRQARHTPPRPDPVPRRLADRRQTRRGYADPDKSIDQSLAASNDGTATPSRRTSFSFT